MRFKRLNPWVVSKSVCGGRTLNKLLLLWGNKKCSFSGTKSSDQSSSTQEPWSFPLWQSPSVRLRKAAQVGPQILSDWMLRENLYCPHNRKKKKFRDFLKTRYRLQGKQISSETSQRHPKCNESWIKYPHILFVFLWANVPPLLYPHSPFTKAF